MIRSRTRQPRIQWTALIAIVAVCFGLLATPPLASANATRTVSYHGLKLRVPSSWPVFRLGAGSSVCVRFNRHAVYLGRPGTNESCPLHAVGRTEAILVSPGSYTGLLAPVSRLSAGPSAGSMARIGDAAHHLIITATWNRHPQLVRAALWLRSLRAAMLATNGHRPPVARGSTIRSHAIAHEITPGPAAPGQVYTGLAFDTCTTQSEAAMAAWGGSSPYGAVGIYIGGTNAACLGGNLNASWVSTESAAGWHLLPLYVGLQAPGNGCGCQALSTTLTNGQYATAASQGTAAAQDAVAQAQALGLGSGNPIYFDMENYKRTTAASGAVLAFLQAWTQQLHASGYLSGVYSSGSSGVADLVANYGTAYLEPDELWTAAWSPTTPSTPPTSAATSWVPSADWPGPHQLLQYYSDAQGKVPYETYGGTRISIDRDYVNAPTAAVGAGTLLATIPVAPTVTVRPQADGSVKLLPRWPGEPGVTAYNILAGAAPVGLTPLTSVTTDTVHAVKLHDVHAFYEVQALNAAGQVLGTSAPVATPPSVAIFGNSGFVGARGPVGVPVACLNATTCEVQGAIYQGTQLLAQTSITAIPRQGGQLLFPLSAQEHQALATAKSRRLAVTVTLTASNGATASRPLQLIPYTSSGASPQRHSWASAALQILGTRSFVSNAWTGGVLAVCRSSTPCVATTKLTRAGAALATPRTQTLGAGEIGYLTYRLSAQGHALLRALPGNQLGARVTVTTAPPAPSAAGSVDKGPRTAMALVSLESFR